MACPHVTPHRGVTQAGVAWLQAGGLAAQTPGEVVPLVAGGQDHPWTCFGGAWLGACLTAHLTHEEAHLYGGAAAAWGVGGTWGVGTFAC